jgi:hypothetical protein
MMYDLSQPTHIAAFPILIQHAGGAWTRAIAWDEGVMA